MAAVWMAARAQLRRRWGSTVALALLVGLAGGVVLAAVAGASRTDSAMRRFVAYSRPEDGIVIVNGPQLEGPPDAAAIAQVLASRASIAHLPQVEETGRAPFLFMSADRTGKEAGAISVFGAADAHAFRTMDRPLLLHGRLARVDRPGEAVVDDLAAAQRHLHVGSRVTLWSFSVEQSESPAVTAFSKIPAPEGPQYTFRVVGIVRLATAVNAPPAYVTSDAVDQVPGTMLVTPAFLRRYADDNDAPEEALPAMEEFRVRLRHGLADLRSLRRAVQAVVTPGDGQVHLGSDIQSAADKSRRAIHLEAVALLLFAGLAAAAAMLVLGQALARQVAADADESPTLAAMGATRSQLMLVPMARAGLVAIGGSAVAVAFAVALSPLTPLGLARRAEIQPGVSVNAAVLGLGFVAVAVLVLMRALMPAWRSARTLAADRLEQAPARPGPLTRAVAGSGLGPAAVAGVGMSFERGRGVAFRTALLGTFVAVAGVVAAVTFGVSLRHLVDTPRQQGWNWDVVVGNPYSPSLGGDPSAAGLHDEMVRLLATNRRVGAFSGFAFSGFASFDAVTIDGHVVDVASVETIRGSLWNTIVEGRAPVAANEIVLGRDALRQVHRRVGQIVTLRSGDKSVTMRIVGVSLQPTAADLSPRLSGGGAVTAAGLRRLVPGAPLRFVVRYRPGVNKQAAFASLVDDFGHEVLGPFPGGEVGDLARVDSLPYVLAGLLVVLAVGALGLTLLSSVRRHRRDLAVLKTLGFVRRQVTATVAWQATALAVPAVVVGVPAGIGLGRWTWRLVADSVGSVSPPLVPLAAVAVVVPATLLVANLLAGWPAWAAGRVNPARVLRSE